MTDDRDEDCNRMGGEAVMLKAAFRRCHNYGSEITRTLSRKQKILDNDLPEIAEAYRRFREKYPEPGE
ncbi:MAG TPA: hypothetical protein VFZ32_07280 [Micromonosporaceae bacterium]